MNRLIRNIILGLFFISLSGCEKFLEGKSDDKLVIPSTLQDLQALLDNSVKINRAGASASEVSADDYFITTLDIATVPENFRRMYTWEKDNLFVAGTNDWSNVYENVFTANMVLDNIGKVPRTFSNQDEWDNVKGQALFLRAHSFLQGAFIWCLAYDANTANTDLGLPLRLTSDINEKILRSSLAQTYDRIILDLKEAISLLRNVPVHVMRSSKPAAHTLLARTYLSMRQYHKSLKYADSSLLIKNTLLDFNPPSIPSASAAFPFNVTALIYNNVEILYVDRMVTPAIISNTKARIDSTLYQSYKADDLRKTVYFSTNTGVNAGTFSFKGSLEGNLNLFDGPSVSETILMRAECYARAGMVTEALADVNALLKKRWKNTVAFQAITATDAADALTKILAERRKELVMRGLRWMDVKRLNKDGANITLKRNVNAQSYTLAPNDVKYALPIPEDIISISGMPQNLR